MEWLQQNWIFVLFFIIFIGMHLFGRGGCGGHGGHKGHDEEGGEHKGHGEGSTEKSEKKGGRGCC